MWLLIEYGWQYVFPMAGLATLGLGLPLIWFFIKPHRPEYYGWLPDGRIVDSTMVNDTEATIQAGVEYAASTEEMEFTVRQAMKNKSLWIFGIVSTLGMMPFVALMTHTVPYLTDMGIDPIVAATIAGTSIFMRFPTQLIFGWLADRVNKEQIRYLAMIGLAVSAVGLFIFTKASTEGLAWLFAVVIGLGNGAYVGIQAQIRGRYWGRKAFGSIGGILIPFMLTAGVVGPFFAGWVYDTTGSYSIAFNIMLIMSIIAVGIMYFATPPKPPAKITKVTEFL
jgi:cyanate permease